MRWSVNSWSMLWFLSRQRLTGGHTSITWSRKSTHWYVHLEQPASFHVITLCLQLQNDKACFSKVGRKANHDYSVTFNDLQDLQQARQRLLRALSAVESSIESLLGIQTHFDSITAQKTHDSKKSIYIELEVYQSRMKGHQRALIRLLEVSSGTSKLVRYSYCLSTALIFVLAIQNFGLP